MAYRELITTVLGGFPVTIVYAVFDPEPDVGIFEEYLDEWYIKAVNGKTCKKYPQWLEDRIYGTEGEIERLHDKIWRDWKND